MERGPRSGNWNALQPTAKATASLWVRPRQARALNDNPNEIYCEIIFLQG